MFALLIAGCAPSAVLDDQQVEIVYYREMIECVSGEAYFEMPDPAPVWVAYQYASASDDRLIFAMATQTDVGSQGGSITIACADDVGVVYAVAE